MSQQQKNPARGLKQEVEPLGELYGVSATKKPRKGVETLWFMPSALPSPPQQQKNPARGLKLATWVRDMRTHSLSNKKTPQGG